jgi:hypothetical protein
MAKVRANILLGAGQQHALIRIDLYQPADTRHIRLPRKARSHLQASI